MSDEGHGPVNEGHPSVDRVNASATFAATPATTSLPEQLLEYWAHGKGAARIRWGTPGDFERCRRHLREHVPQQHMLNGLCANLHRRATGNWPGDDRHHSETTTQ
ncbi:hypothetical protein [Actinopolyspora erythraea]|uniref:hypothetical protein n=1 Tax=Actinopolyspora erythraea TaxID=414996 RepID=UPI001C0FA4BA|nr:hypothetical protein [Actinopolyspora erythraea]